MAVKLILYLLYLCTLTFGLKLEKVLILSRHNLRQSLTENLQQFTPHEWPIANFTPGYLTAKGAALEENMGEYLSNWLRKEKLLPNGCPDESSISVYANTRQRTRETGKAFVKGAFKDCKINVHSIDSDEMDPIFNPIFRNNSTVLKEKIIEEMNIKLNSLDLNDMYEELDTILDIKNSYMCKENNFCSFVNKTNEIVYEINDEPNVIGPLRYANAVADGFLMSYYEGTPIEDVAWGQMNDSKQWESLGKVTQGYQIVRFNGPNLSKEVAKPLVKYIHEALLNKTIFTLLIGHDSNLESVMAALNVKPYVLPGQNELTPIGGKLMLQKWHDESTNEDLFKAVFVYQTTAQIRNGDHLSNETPPKFLDVELNSCPVDKYGFCSWDKFLNILEDLK